MINCLLVENNSGNHDLQETVRKRVFSLHIGFCAEKNLRDHWYCPDFSGKLRDMLKFLQLMRCRTRNRTQFSGLPTHCFHQWLWLPLTGYFQCVNMIMKTSKSYFIDISNLIWILLEWNRELVLVVWVPREIFMQRWAR